MSDKHPKNWHSTASRLLQHSAICWIAAVGLFGCCSSNYELHDINMTEHISEIEETLCGDYSGEIAVGQLLGRELAESCQFDSQQFQMRLTLGAAECESTEYQLGVLKSVKSNCDSAGGANIEIEGHLTVDSIQFPVLGTVSLENGNDGFDFDTRFEVERIINERLALTFVPDLKKLSQPIEAFEWSYRVDSTSGGDEHVESCRFSVESFEHS